MVKPLTNVTVHSKDGEPFTFTPDDELPDWAVKKISNPNVLPDQSGRDDSDQSRPGRRAASEN
jgi:hypothetical protein